MTDWQILDSDKFPQEPPEESSGTRSRWRWLGLVGGILLCLGLIGWLALRNQLAENRTALRQDLAAFILEEETQRFLQNHPQIEGLITTNAPTSWLQAYRRQFSDNPPEQPPDTVQLKTIDFDGTCALVTVGLDTGQQLRTYCLDGPQWRRAPVPASAWGDEPMMVEIAGNLQLRFRPRDKTFGLRLSRQLERFSEAMDQWAFRPGAVGRPAFIFEPPLEIIIEPHELRPPVVAQEPRRIVLNSPWLTPAKAGLSGEATIRLALARLLLRRVGPFVEISQDELPGTSRFMAAAQTVVAARLMLSPEEQAALRREWGRQMGEAWVTPLLGDLLYLDQPPPAQQLEAAAHLLVDHLYQSRGPATLALLIHRLPLASSWDELFSTTLGETAFTVAQQAATEAGLSPPRATGPDPLPLTATFSRVQLKPTGGSHVYATWGGQNLPLLVELPTSVPFRTGDGQFVPANCVPPGSQLEIEGHWLERPQRLAATQMTVRAFRYLEITPAPKDTVAYLLVGQALDEGEEAASQRRVYPGTRSYLVASNSAMAYSVVALRPNGTLQSMLDLAPNLQIRPLPIASGGQPHFVLVLDIPDCGRSWILHFEPQQGITGQWLSPLPPMQWVWRPDRQAPIFFRRKGDAPGYDILETDDSLALEAVGVSKLPLLFIGWHTQAGQLVAVNSWFGETYIGLFDLASGDLDNMVRPRYQPLRFRRLSPNGDWLVHLAGVQNLFGPPDRLDVMSLSGQPDTTLIQVGPGEGLGEPVWSLYLEQLAIAVVAGSVTDGDELRPTRLLVARPAQPEQYTVAARAAPGELLGTPVFCAGGTLLYPVEAANRYHLRRQMPGQPSAETLLSLEQPFQPLACP